MRPSDGQRTPLPEEIICSTCVVVTTSGNVPKPHSGLFTESKCVKPVARIAAPTSIARPSETCTENAPGLPENASTRALVCTSTSGSLITRSTMPPIASFAHSPVGTSFA